MTSLLLDVDHLRFLVEASCSIEPKVVVVACCFLFFICCLLSVTCLCTQTAYLLLSHRRLQCEQGDFKRKTPVAIVHVALLHQVWYHLGRIRRTSRGYLMCLVVFARRTSQCLCACGISFGTTSRAPFSHGDTNCCAFNPLFSQPADITCAMLVPITALRP